MIYDVRHLTTVQYAGGVRLARFNLRLKPASWPGQILRDYALNIDPAPSAIQQESGPWVVNRARLSIDAPLKKLSIEARFRVEVAPPCFRSTWRSAPPWRKCANARWCGAICRPPAPPVISTVPRWRRFRPRSRAGRPVLHPGTPTLAAGRALMEAIHGEFKYDGSATWRIRRPTWRSACAAASARTSPTS
jgi:hypothetical protein